MKQDKFVQKHPGKLNPVETKKMYIFLMGFFVLQFSETSLVSLHLSRRETKRPDSIFLI